VVVESNPKPSGNFSMSVFEHKSSSTMRSGVSRDKCAPGAR
jgi:hypothetical protein